MYNLQTLFVCNWRFLHILSSFRSSHLHVVPAVWLSSFYGIQRVISWGTKLHFSASILLYVDGSGIEKPSGWGSNRPHAEIVVRYSRVRWPIPSFSHYSLFYPFKHPISKITNMLVLLNDSYCLLSVVAYVLLVLTFKLKLDLQHCTKMCMSADYLQGQRYGKLMF